MGKSGKFELRFWKGKNSAVEGGLLSEVFLGRKDYDKLEAARIQASAARKTATLCGRCARATTEIHKKPETAGSSTTEEDSTESEAESHAEDDDDSEDVDLESHLDPIEPVAPTIGPRSSAQSHRDAREAPSKTPATQIRTSEVQVEATSDERWASAIQRNTASARGSRKALTQYRQPHTPVIPCISPAVNAPQGVVSARGQGRVHPIAQQAIAGADHAGRTFATSAAQPARSHVANDSPGAIPGAYPVEPDRSMQQRTASNPQRQSGRPGNPTHPRTSNSTQPSVRPASECIIQTRRMHSVRPESSDSRRYAVDSASQTGSQGIRTPMAQNWERSREVMDGGVDYADQGSGSGATPGPNISSWLNGQEGHTLQGQAASQNRSIQHRSSPQIQARMVQAGSQSQRLVQQKQHSSSSQPRSGQANEIKQNQLAQLRSPSQAQVATLGQPQASTQSQGLRAPNQQSNSGRLITAHLSQSQGGQFHTPRQVVRNLAPPNTRPQPLLPIYSQQVQANAIQPTPIEEQHARNRAMFNQPMQIPEQAWYADSGIPMYGSTYCSQMNTFANQQQSFTNFLTFNAQVPPPPVGLQHGLSYMSGYPYYFAPGHI